MLEYSKELFNACVEFEDQTTKVEKAREDYLNNPDKASRNRFETALRDLSTASQKKNIAEAKLLQAYCEEAQLYINHIRE